MAAVQKRKREAHDLPGARPAPAMTAPVPVGTEFDQQYLHAVDDGSGTTNDMGLDFGSLAPADGDAADPAEPPVSTPTPGRAGVAATAVMARYHTMKVPQSTEQAFVQKAEHGTSAAAAAGSGNGGDRPPSSSGMGGEGGDARAAPAGSFGNFDASGARGGSPPRALPFHAQSSPKPSVGSDEWHKVRKDNHKEVERRRRETINEGINELAKIVPGCEKNKGSILSRAVHFITQLKENEASNIEKWTLEKLLTEQAVAELSSSCDKLKAECQRAWTECEAWKKAARDAGVAPPPAVVAAAAAASGAAGAPPTAPAAQPEGEAE